MSRIDVMIQITLGVDLNKEKAETIRKNGVYLFVANEIYESRLFLQKIDGVLPVRELNLNTLKKWDGREFTTREEGYNVRVWRIK